MANRHARLLYSARQTWQTRYQVHHCKPVRVRACCVWALALQTCDRDACGRGGSFIENVAGCVVRVRNLNKVLAALAISCPPLHAPLHKLSTVCIVRV